MKSFLLSLGAAVLLTVSAGAQKTVETSFWVGGVCSMCEERIEAALDVKGVKFADYNLKTNQLKVAFNSEKISETQLHKLLNEIGHDTSKSKATDAAYDKVHGCCKYRDGKSSGCSPGCTDACTDKDKKKCDSKCTEKCKGGSDAKGRKK